jgi:trehalose 6-phosphate phosphatase
MKALEIQAPYSSFLDQLKAARERILLLDYDGTLAPFTSNRDQAAPYPEVPSLLGEIMAGGTRVVLVTGRAARDLAQLCGLDPHPEIWGSHGAERLTPDGSYTLDPGLSKYREGLESAAAYLRGRGFDPHVEVKPGGVALHWRGLTDSGAADLKEQVLQVWMPLVIRHRLNLLEFDGGVELRAPGFNKGAAVRAILAEAAPDAAVAYLGDDTTDEDAFEALRGKGLTILVRPEPRSTAAEIWLQPPKELIQFLQDWLRACGGEA